MDERRGSHDPAVRGGLPGGLAFACIGIIAFTQASWAVDMPTRPPASAARWEADSFEAGAPDAVLVRASRIAWDRAARDAAGLPPWVEFSLSQRARYESVSNNWRRGQRPGTNQQYALQSRLRLGVRRGGWSLVAEAQDARNPGAEAGDFVGRMRNELDVLQLFTALTLENGGGTRLRADTHVGRFALDLGSSRLLGRNGFPNTTSSYEGVHLSLASPAGWRLRGFLTRPVEIRATELDRGATDEMLWGVALESDRLEKAHGEVYVLGLIDDADANPSRAASLASLGVRTLREAPSGRAAMPGDTLGRWHYEVEGIAQIGERFGRDHLAGLAAVNVGYTFNTPGTPMLLGEYLYASGTADPEGERSATFDRRFGLRLGDLTQTSLWGPFAQSNHQLIGWRIAVRPVRNLRLEFKHHVNWLAQARDIIDGSSVVGDELQDPTGRAGNALGQDLEIVARYRFGPNVALSAGWSYWFKGSYFDRLAQQADRGGLPPDGEDNSAYVWAQTLVRF